MPQNGPHPPTLATEDETGLIGLLPVLEIVKTLIYTGQVKGERPASAIICAPIGSGKTSVMEKIVCKQSEFLGDFTARDASRIVRKENLTHIMIGDFLSVLNHKAGTTALSLQILAKLTGESLLTDPFTGQPLPAGLSLGVISGVPPDEFYNNKKLARVLFGSGFASRFLVIRYEYTEATRRSIHRWIKTDRYTKTKPYQFHVDPGRYEINVPPHIADKIELLSDRVKHDDLGARAHHHLRALVKARARMAQRKEVEEEDYQFIEEVSDLFCRKGRSL